MKKWIFTLLIFSYITLCFGQKNICRCTPSDNCWPQEKDWQTLSSQVHQRLIKPHHPLNVCIQAYQSQACQNILKKLRNPFFLESQVGLTQSTGWIKAWTASLSHYAVAAKSAEDIAYAVNFAREHRD